jgi:hypothetical protein
MVVLFERILKKCSAMIWTVSIWRGIVTMRGIINLSIPSQAAQPLLVSQGLCSAIDLFS